MSHFVEGVVIDYMYRDASNYKQHDTLQLAGEWKPSHSERLQAISDDDEYVSFIPEQVGVSCLVGEMVGEYDDDHPWHELWLRPEDRREVTVPAHTRTIEDFVAAMESAAAEGWNQSLCEEIE